MAYEVHWQIDFYTPDEEHYRVEILEDDYSEDIVHLIGADDPFDTQDDNSSDAFTPIRKQTGMLRIADTGYDMEGNEFDYTDLLPFGTFDFQVRLWHVGTTNTLRWIGYIRPDSLTSKMFEAVSIREYQLTCPLGTLYETYISFSAYGLNALPPFAAETTFPCESRTPFGSSVVPEVNSTKQSSSSFSSGSTLN